MHEEKLYPWRWAILVGMTILLVALQFAFIIPGGAALLVMQEYQCEPMWFSMIMSIPYFSGVLLCIAGGVMADRIGLNKVFAVAFIIAALGALGRCFAVDYWTLFAASFVMGTGVAALNANSAKLLRLWFPGTANSFAMGVYTAGMSGGAALAIFVGSHLDNVHTAWWISFVLIVVGLIAWFGLYRKHPDGENTTTEPVGVYMKEVVKDKYVWAIAITAFLVFGMTNVNGSYMVPAVTTLMGDPTMAPIAGNMSTLNTVIACVASMALPVVFAKVFKNIRAPFIICLVGTAVCFALVYFLPYGPMTWFLYCLQPLLMASVMPFTKMLPTLLPSVKPEHYGVVGGIQATLQNFGMFLLASYVISPIAIASTGAVDGLVYYQGVYVATAVLCVIAALSLFLFPNVRSSVAGKIEDDMATAKQD
ncbi:MAG: nitrate/nitrite transporter [Coriobacteriales bacterium]